MAPKEFNFSAWYEFFPRSEGASITSTGQVISGNFKTATKSLERVAEMGFDVIYLPPIHPIGIQYRKGKNNSLTPLPTDPGVPWAIGSHLGGHDAINPDLGTISDFKLFIKAAEKLNLQVAMDLALQTSPDHPWVGEHPNWFTIRPDGSIAYAENPPKKYQDIFPINFDIAFEEIVAEVVNLIQYWVKVGVKIFRVDNPHTKPVNFWQIVIAKIRQRNAEVQFLSESFTRPTMIDRKSTRLNSSHTDISRMPSSA